MNEASPDAKRAKQEYAKGIWLVTYAACSPDIAHEMLHNNGICCDQLYCITWRESKYALIHLKQSNRVRSTALSKAMERLKESHGVRGSCIIGYDPLACNTNGESTVEDHPAFRKMVENLNTGKEISIWIQDGDIRSYRKGLLYKYIDGADPKLLTHGQLARQAIAWAPIVKEATVVKEENELLRSTLAARERVLSESQQMLIAQDARIDEMFQRLLTKMKECTELKKRLIENGIDHTWTANHP